MRSDQRRAALTTVAPVQQAAPATPALPVCGGCKHWAELESGDPRAVALAKRGPVGECRESPPVVQLAVGPVLGYGLTDRGCPACGRFAKR